MKPTAGGKLRLNKFLADRGVASRRAADELIRHGHVTVNGRRPALGESIDPAADIVSVNGKRVRKEAFAEHVTLVLNKPAGIITTMDDEHGRPTVAKLLPSSRRLFPIGRLDAETTGVLLCTTDGGLARVLAHPSSGIVKRYVVTARGSMPSSTIAALNARDYLRSPDGSHRFTIELSEGRNRQIRRLCAQAGLRILSLTRTAFGPVRLAGLKIGCTRELEPHEARELNRLRDEHSRR
ncbi:MAG: rRNA pseudouridine synthase [Candidatus Eremiobacteraeota bacterium]|nr:rRNA pseudouridine synthase [Candidatus Eremiobacteraeota bacterium]MBV8596068.1 rRNA pseudouridine synthase [Candidatus Eremiobacteraeota bacterium]